VVAKDPARAYAGKQKSEAQLQAIRHQMGLDKPKWRQFLDVLTFQFPQSLRYQESVWSLFARKAPVSLAIQLPVFVIELGLQLALAMFVASRRGQVADYLTTFVSVLLMSVPALSIYLGVQWLLAGKLQWFPVAGWDRGFFTAIHFAALPILVSVFGGLGGGVRFYRTVALEEINSDYVRTARAKGVTQSDVLFTHVFRNMLIPVLRAAGYDVTAASEGQEALFQIRSGRKFDLIVTDLQMPGMDGFALARAVRVEPTTAGIPMIALSSMTTAETIERVRRAGFQDFVAKFDRPGLIAAIKEETDVAATRAA